jgi:hypothetical protein
MIRDFMSNSSLRERFSLPDEDYQAVSADHEAVEYAGGLVGTELGLTLGEEVGVAWARTTSIRSRPLRPTLVLRS